MNMSDNDSLTTTYQICDHSLNTWTGGIFYSMEEAIRGLYVCLFAPGNTIEKYEVGIIYGDIYIETLRVKYDGGLILYNEQNKLFARLLFPNLAIYDLSYNNKIQPRFMFQESNSPHGCTTNCTWPTKNHDVQNVQNVQTNDSSREYLLNKNQPLINAPTKNQPLILSNSPERSNRHTNLLKKASVAVECMTNTSSSPKNEYKTTTKNTKRDHGKFDEEFEKKRS